jgi:hypothetical protein
MPTPPDFTAYTPLAAASLNKVGLWLVKSQTVGTTVASVTVTGAFSAEFDNYLITINGINGTTSGAALYMTLITSAPADNAANWKGNTVFIVTGASGGFGNAPYNNTTGGEVGSLSTTAGQMKFDVLGPFLSQRTNIAYNNTDNAYFRISSGVLDNATSYVSFRLAPNAGTLTGGTIRVYGYRN